MYNKKLEHEYKMKKLQQEQGCLVALVVIGIVVTIVGAIAHAHVLKWILN